MDQLPPIMRYLMGGLFLGLGGVMLLWNPGPNRWLGVRLPWTLADRDIWDRSWRLAVVFLVGMGAGVFISPKIFFISLAHLVILGLGYPIYLYRRKYGTLRVWKAVGCLDYRPVARCRVCGHLQKLEDAVAWGTAHCEQCHSPLSR